MAAPALTYSLSNATPADADKVQQNFTDLLNGCTDGLKDLTVNSVTYSGTAIFRNTGASKTVTLRALPGMIGASYTLSLPDAVAAGSNYALSYGTSGAMNWSPIPVNVMTAVGDLMYGGTAAADGISPATRLAGAAGVLHGGVTTAPSWSTIVNADVSALAAIDGSKLVAATASVAGAVTTANQVFAGRKSSTNTRVRANRSVNQVIGLNTDTIIQYDSEDFDTNSEYASSVIATTNTTTNGTTTATVASATNIAVGHVVAGTNIAADTTVVAISGTTITLSIAATGSGTNSTTYSTYRFTPTVSGYYLIYAQFRIDSVADGKNISIVIRKNGSGIANFLRNSAVIGADVAEFISTSTLVSLNGSTDYIDFTASQNDSSNRNLRLASGNSYFYALQVF